MTSTQELSTAQVAVLLGVSRQRVHQLANTARIPHYRDALGHRRFPLRCVEAFIAERSAPAA